MCLIIKSSFLTLEGELHWNYQREAANKTVKNVIGVKGVSNNITIKSETHDAIEKEE